MCVYVLAPMAGYWCALGAEPVRQTGAEFVIIINKLLSGFIAAEPVGNLYSGNGMQGAQSGAYECDSAAWLESWCRPTGRHFCLASFLVYTLLQVTGQDMMRFGNS